MKVVQAPFFFDIVYNMCILLSCSRVLLELSFASKTRTVLFLVKKRVGNPPSHKANWHFLSLHRPVDITGSTNKQRCECGPTELLVDSSAVTAAVRR
jgi:hypothetical protein